MKARQRSISPGRKCLTSQTKVSRSIPTNQGSWAQHPNCWSWYCGLVPDISRRKVFGGSQFEGTQFIMDMCEGTHHHGVDITSCPESEAEERQKVRLKYAHPSDSYPPGRSHSEASPQLEIKCSNTGVHGRHYTLRKHLTCEVWLPVSLVTAECTWAWLCCGRKIEK